MYTYVWKHAFIYMYINLHALMKIYIHIYICIYIYIYSPYIYSYRFIRKYVMTNLNNIKIVHILPSIYIISLSFKFNIMIFPNTSKERYIEIYIDICINIFTHLCIYKNIKYLFDTYVYLSF
jgi:hypothetical protein